MWASSPWYKWRFHAHAIEIAGLEGAFILSRTRQSGTPFITVGEWLATILEQLPTERLRTYHW
jgi:hypothetical protein